MTSSGSGQVPFIGLMRIEKFFPGDPGTPAGPAGPTGPAGPIVPESPLSPLSPLGPSKHPESVNAATHAINAIATRIICLLPVNPPDCGHAAEKRYELAPSSPLSARDTASYRLKLAYCKVAMSASGHKQTLPPGLSSSGQAQLHNLGSALHGVALALLSRRSPSSRRDFIRLLGSVATAWPLTTHKFSERGRDSFRPQMEADHVKHCDSQWTEK